MAKAKKQIAAPEQESYVDPTDQGCYIIFRCPESGEPAGLELTHLELRAYTQYGSGYVEVRVYCDACYKYHKILLNAVVD